MGRRGVLNNITAAQTPVSERKVTPDYASRGASRSMLSSITELSEKAAIAEQLLEGASIVDIDPALVDDSFVPDRMIEAQDTDTEYDGTAAAIREKGQETPVLLRPSPEHPGRYQIVFGHRRTRIARQLGRMVRAVVRPMSDVDHVVAQGQENSARSNLSFIERAMYAQRLLNRGFDRPVIQAALTADAPMLTRMLSVTSRIPEDVILSIGAAKTVGRDRWTDLAQAIESPAGMACAREIIATSGFAAEPSEERFRAVIDGLAKLVRSRRRETAKPAKLKWEPSDKRVSAELTDSGKRFDLTLKSKDASRFGRYIADNLDSIYLQFKETSGDE